MKSFPVKFPSMLMAALVLAIGLLTFSSCQTEGCTDPMSDNYDPEAKKDDGSCIPWRDKFLGSYSASQSCTGVPNSSGTLVATVSSKGENVVLFTFDDLSITGTLATSTTLIIDNQTVNYQGQDVTVSGTGSLSNETDLQLNFTISAGVVNSVCEITGTKL